MHPKEKLKRLITLLLYFGNVHIDNRHPDKNNSPEAEEKFVQIGKAYATLTDEDLFAKWQEFGNEEGKREFSWGIALPPELVDKKNMFLVLFFYALLFGVILPVMVGKW